MLYKILFIGDVIGRPGRKKIKEVLKDIVEREGIFFVIINGENLAGGLGINEKVADEMFSIGVDVITTGNHVWRKREALDFLKREERILRPANLPPGNPGRGYGIFEKNGVKIAVINLVGRVFMNPYEHPFLTADRILQEVEADLIIVDFHAEATSEKKAMGFYLDGRVSAVLGTHTHVPTADERILPKGTLYITDVGMTGAVDSIIGMDKEKAIRGFLTLIPEKFTPARGKVEMNGVILTFDDNFKGISIERIRL